MKKWFYKAGAGMAGVLFVASAMALFAPKAVHAVVSALVTVANTSANPVPAQEVKESRANFITVSFDLALGTSTYDEVSPDGTVSENPFVIPSGEQFVITDVNWITTCGDLFASPACTKHVGDAVVFMLGGDRLSPGSYMSQSSYSANAFGLLTAGRNDSLKSGLVVTQLPTPSILFDPPSNGEQILVVNLRGYLVP